MMRTTLKRLAAFLILAGAPLAARAAGAAERPIEKFSGEASGGQAFARKLKSGLTFELQPRFNGSYAVWMGDAARLSDNFCMVLTPPFHGPNALQIEGYQLQGNAAPADGAPGKVRSFKCVADEKTYEEAFWALQRTLWAPPKGAASDTAAKAREILDQAGRAGLEGRLTVKSVRLSKSANGKPRIARIKFMVELFAPAARQAE